MTYGTSVKTLSAAKIAVKFVKENLIFTGDDSPMNNLLLTLLGAVAEFERSMIHERQREGIALAKARGVYKGRKQQLTAQQVGALTARDGYGEPKAKIARDLGISRNTLYTNLERLP